MAAHDGAARQQPPCDLHRRRVADVVRAGLEGEPEHRDRSALEPAQQPGDPVGKARLLRAVRGRRGNRHVHVEAARVPRGGKRLELLGQAAAPEPERRPHVLRADSRVKGNPGEDLVDLRAVLLREGGNLVGERELQGKECVRAILDQLGGGDVDDHARGIDVGEQGLHPRLTVRVGVGEAAEDDPRRRAEVREGRALAKELRVA